MDQAGGKAKEGADAMRRFLAHLEENSKLDTADKIARIAGEEGAPYEAVAHIRGTLELALDPSAAPQVAMYIKAKHEQQCGVSVDDLVCVCDHLLVKSRWSGQICCPGCCCVCVWSGGHHPRHVPRASAPICRSLLG